MTRQEFVQKIAEGVRKYAPAYDIKVHSPIIAQAILESGYGESGLAKYNNFFGLKCGSKWKGHSVNMKTMEEYTTGTLTEIRDNFRAYDSFDEGVKGYFEFVQLPRYANLKGITDPRKYLETIKADGYATSSTYVENCMKVIEKENLTQYDGDRKESAKVGYSRQAVVDTANSWLGLNEADGSYKKIIDIYNSKPPFPRGTKMAYGWAWCACTWSAIAKKLGYEAIMPIEISCQYLIAEAQKMGIWVENDGYCPQPGDAILYDWDDNGAGDDTGVADHVGTVVYVNKGAGYFVVVEGNASNMVKKRTVSINGRYIRGFITPRYTESGTTNTSTSGGAKKSVSEVAHEVIAGAYGNGDARKQKLTAEGYDPAAVQQEVNRILNGSAAKPTAQKSVSEVAKEVIAGAYGNGDTRKQKLTAKGYDPEAVQQEVNRILNGSGSASAAKPTQTAPAASAKKVTATCYASGKDASLAGSYTVTAGGGLYLRNDAGTNKQALCLIPKGTTVHCYGYYSTFNGAKWLYITFTMSGVQYTGFAHSGYLRRQ